MNHPYRSSIEVEKLKNAVKMRRPWEKKDDVLNTGYLQIYTWTWQHVQTDSALVSAASRAMVGLC